MVKILQAYNFAKQNTFALNGEILAATLIDSNRIAISSAEQFIEIYDIVGRTNTETHCGGVGEDGDGGEVVTAVSAATSNDDDRSPIKYSLATVGEVVNLIYCEAGKYLITLEKENVASPVHTNSTSISCTSSSNNTVVYSEDDIKMFVRVYANFWKFPESKLIDLPITIRIASMTTPKAPLVKSIDVIELPLRSPPDLIQCCQTSGNVIVSSKERIYLYEYTQCVHESTQPRYKYIDFLPFKFFVNLNFVPSKLNLAENVIACMSNRYCVAFRVVDVLASNVCTAGEGTAGIRTTAYDQGNYEGEDNADLVEGGDVISSSGSSIVSKTSVGPSSHSHNSFETDSLETTASGRLQTNFPGRTPIDFNVARLVNSACGREFEVDLRSQWEIGDNDGNGGPGGMNCGKSNVTCDTQEIIITPTRANEIKIKLVNEAKAMNVQRISSNGKIVSAYNEDNMVQYDIRKLLQICMKSSESGGGRVVDILRCMDLKAIYQHYDRDSGELEDPEYEMGNQQVPGAITTSKHINRRTLKSPKHQSCIGFALLVASSVDGYLYQFCAQGKWYNENEKPIATYSFTAPVLQVHINDYVIYAVTTESVETHTSRIGQKLFNNRFEYPTLAEQFPEESSPDVNAPIAVIGLCSFIHVQYVCVNRNNLVLISNGSTPCNQNNGGDNTSTTLKRRNAGGSGDNGKRNIAARLIAEAKAKHNLLRLSSSSHTVVVNEWTLYNLEVPLVEHVIDDLENIAESYRSASSSNFYDLMEEAHVMLRMSISLQFENFHDNRETKLRNKFMDNCRKLADFSIRSRKKEVHMQATGFYKMCNLQLPEIYTNYIKNFLNKDTELTDDDNYPQRDPITPGDDPSIGNEQLAGLIYTVKLFLIDLGTDRLKASFLNQSVKPFFTPSRVIKQGYTQVPLSLEFLNLFIKYSPMDIPQVMLDSLVVADSISGEIINYLKFLDSLNADENLLLAVTACRMSNYILSQEVVCKTNRHSLATALIKHKNVIFDDSTPLYQKQKRGKIENSSTGDNSKCSQSQLKDTKRHFCGTNRQSGSSFAGGVQPSFTEIVSFSDFTETILLATEKQELIEAISDVFIHALCVEHSITLECLLQLFLNFIASHIGQKGYQTSQKVFVNILQVYYYDLFDVNPSSGHQELPSNSPPQIDDAYEEGGFSKVNSEQDTESIANSNADSVSAASSSIADDRRVTSHYNRIVYDHLQEQHSPYKRNSNVSLLNGIEEPSNAIEINSKGLKILFRMYMGRLKALSDLITDLQSADVEQQSLHEDFMSLRLECIGFMIRHLQELRQEQQYLQSANQLYYATKSQLINGHSEERKLVFVPFIPDYKLSGDAFEQHLKSYIRPIPCLLDRPQYLNRLPPFRRGDFSYPNKDEGETDVHFVGWHNELLTLTLKIQSLLASTKIDREIIEEFIAFVQKTPNLIGIDSFLVIVLPKHLAINYMLSFCPEYLWQYGKSNNFNPKQWESLLKKLVHKKDMLPNWKIHITEILNNLAADLSFEELLQCFPPDVLQSRHKNLWAKEFASECKTTIAEDGSGLVSETTLDPYLNTIARDHVPMDNVDENNVFEMTLRKAVAKQRSIALRSMIESTGKQLFDATSNPMYNL
uniref:BLOC-2 complex member HPS3 C-terminal domain-containing protein n=1 Tax=Glossina brevipalpis TaxID=37001 RepID=A0A1A9WE22_9MUSC